MYTGIRKFLLTLQVLCLLSIAIFQIPIGQGAKLPPSFFTVTIMVPTNNLERLQYAEAISTELAKIGINIELEMKTWAEIIPRVFYEESPPHAEGGYDICFFAVELGSSTDHPGGLIKTQYLDIPPDGFNVMYWSAEKEDQMNYLASSSSDLITAINSNVNLTEARADFYEFQKIWYDCLPNNIIYSQNNVFLISNGLFGYDPLKNPLASFETLWTNSSYPGDNNSLVMVTSLPCSNFNGLIDNRQGGDDAYSNIDYYCSLLPLDSLLGFTPSNEIILPSDYNRSKWNLDSFNTSKPLEIYPRVAKELGSFSSNGLQYNLTVRDDVLWHDGHQLDAWDVLFSYQSHYLVGLEKEWVDAIGESNIESKTGLYSFIVEDKNQDDFFEHIRSY
jgi:ABC-type transport system substrate-binding protein